MHLNTQRKETFSKLAKNINTFVSKAVSLIMLGLSGKQWMASIVICLLLSPICSVPVKARTVVLVNPDADNFEAVNEELWFWESAQRNLNAKIEAWSTPKRETNILHDEVVKKKENDPKEKKENEGVKRKGKKGEGLRENSEKKPADKEENRKNNAEISGRDAEPADRKIENEELIAESKKSDVNQKEDEISKNPEREAIEEAVAPTVFDGNERSEEEIESLFEPYNNPGTPTGQVEAQAPNSPVANSRRSLERPGSSNHSFDIPVASLPGRGIGVGIRASYNGQVWSLLNSPIGTFYSYNSDKNWLSPGFNLSLGKIERLDSENYSYISSNGTRHQLHYVSGSIYARTYESYDGTFMKLDTTSSDGEDTTGAVLHGTGGSVMNFAIPDADNDNFYPNKIIDQNGNYIEVTYQTTNTEDGRISNIKDTLGRFVQFYYDSSNRLVTVTVPGFNNSTARQTVRFYYETMTFPNVNRFLVRPDGMPQSIDVLKYVYFPGTDLGYKYEYSAGYGMIYKVSDLRGMQVDSTSLTSTGNVTSEGQVAASTEYNYPLTVGPINGLPNYTTRTDDWAGRTTAQASVTTYQVETDTVNYVNYVKSQITSPNGTITESWAIDASNWKNGLVTDIFIKTPTGPQLQTYKIWSHQKYFWENSPTSPGRQNPRLVKTESTNDSGQTRAVTNGHDSYNNVTEVREYDFAPPGQLGTELVRSEIIYETGSGWSDNRIFSLPKEVKRIVNGTTVKKTLFEYDDYGSGESEMTQRSDIIMFDEEYNPSSGSYNTATKYRGNATKITAFSDATLPSDPNASITTIKYDIAGNAVETVANCCNKVISEYSKITEYAHQTSGTRGIGSEELSTSVTYDFNTSLIKTSTDDNNQVTSVTYDPNNLRQTRIDLPHSGYLTYEHEDGLVSGPNGLKWSYVKSTGKIDATNEVSSWKYLDGRGAVVRTLGTPFNGEHPGVVDIEYNAAGQVARTSNPYSVTSFSSPINPSNNWTTPSYDPLNRVVLVTLPDGNTTQTEFNGTNVTVTDQAGRKRRQVVNALALVIRTDEPDTNGNLGDINNPNQPTYFEYNGNKNLTKITQTDTGSSITQERLLKYDSLSRLTHEKQVEATPTLDDNGVVNPTTGQWTNVNKYNISGLLTEGINARGVKTSFTYDTLNRLKTVIHTGETGYQTPNLTYTYDEARAGFFNKGRLTKVETAQVGTDTPSTTQIYDYDLIGQVKKETQMVGTNSYTSEYGYNIGGRLISQKYPSGRTVNLQIDSIARPSAISDSNRTYSSNYQYSTPHGAISSVDFGNGTTQSYTFDSHLQLTGLSLVKGADIIQKYEYGYGKVDLATGNLDTSKNTGQLARIDSYIGGTTSNPTKQWQQRFDYDELGRLREVREHRGDTNALSYKYKFDFDRFGNLYRKSASNPATGQETPLAYQWTEDSDIDKASNRFSSATGTLYDDEGNVTRDTKFRGLDYKYDANGRMVWSKLADNTGSDATSVYNALGYKVATKVDGNWNVFVYDNGGKIVAEYGFTSASDEGGVKYYTQDRQGSTSAMLSQSGFVKSRFNYQAFGEEIGTNVGMRTAAQGFSSNQSYRNKYAMNEKDEASGLYHTWWRKLESQAGRWTSPDLFKGAASLGDPQSFNRYAYITNDPINSVDPTGLYDACAHAAMTRFIGQLAGVGEGDVSQLAKYAGGDDPDAADGKNYKATNPENIAVCLAVRAGPNVTIHFASAAQMRTNARLYSTYLSQGNYIRAGHMLHSLQDGYGAHNGYSNVACVGHAVPDGAKGLAKGIGNITLGDLVSKPAGQVVADVVNTTLEEGHGTDRVLGDADFIKAANATYQTMAGDSSKTLTNDQINSLINAIVEECGGDKKRWKITRPGGSGRAGGGGGGGGGSSSGGRNRQFEWLYWADRQRTEVTVTVL